MPSYRFDGLEDAVLVKVLRTGSVPQFFLEHVSNDWFVSTERRAAWQEIMRHYRKYGVPPRPETFRRYMTPWHYDESVVTDEPWDFYADKFVEQQTYWEWDNVTEAIGEVMKGSGTDQEKMEKTVGVLRDYVTKVTNFDSAKRMTDAFGGSVSWEQRMAARRAGKTAYSEGVPCGFSHIDSLVHGILPGQLWTVFAPAKSFKTSALCHMAVTFQKSDRHVLFLTFEMSEQEVLDRIDAIHGGYSLSVVRDGRLTEEQADELKALTRGMPSMHVNSGHEKPTVDGVQAIVTEYKPQVVIVDGAYFMFDPASKERGTPRALTNVTRDFKRLASTLNVPVVISTQALTWKMKGKRIQAESIGYSSSFAQDSDLVIGMNRVVEADGSPTDEVNMDIVLSRNSPLSTQTVLWKWDSSSWSYGTTKDHHDDT